MEYARAPTSPQASSTRLPPRASPGRWALRAALALSLLVLGHYAVLGIAAAHLSVPAVSPAEEPPSLASENLVETVADPDEAEAVVDPTGLGLSAETLAVLRALPRGAYVKDAYPIRTMRALLDLAQVEIERAGAETCRDRLGAPLVAAWGQTGRDVCAPPPPRTELRSSVPPEPATTPPLTRRSAGNGSAITCFNPKDGRGSSWWAMGSYPCLSSGLQTSGNASRFTTERECTLPRSRDIYALANLLDRGERVCEHWEDRTTMIVHRRDQWNPYHVAEDLLTVLLNLLIVSESRPELGTERLQLAFSDEFAISGNHYAGLWDRVGAYSPRILELDPLPDNVCFRRLIHGTAHTAPSILTVIPVHRFSGCASAITWAGSHYLRHLFGHHPPSVSPPSSPARKVVRVLFLSRLKLDRWFFKTRQYSHWRGTRHIYNEPAFLAAVSEGLAAFCAARRCRYEHVLDQPDAYLAPHPSSSTTSSASSSDSPSGPAGGDEPILRFTVLDPLLVPLETQAAYLAATDVVLGAHGGALALSLFMPPGAGALVELQVDEIFERNYHFKNLSYQLGRRYKELLVENDVDAGPVLDAVTEMVGAILGE